MKNRILEVLLLSFLVIVSLSTVSCNESDDTIEKTGKPTLTVVNKDITVSEGETAVFDLQIEYATSTKVDVRIDVLDAEGNPIVTTEPYEGDPTSGNGYVRIEIDDIEVPYPTWFDSGWFQYGYLGGTGYVATFAPNSQNIQISIETKDDGISEGSETIQLQFTATSEMAVSIDEIVTLTIND